jgi:transcription-repair coupling factor (superfamily II helicase)
VSALVSLAAGPFASLRERLDREGEADVSGLTGPARFLVPLLLAEGPFLFVVPRERDIDDAVQDLRTLVVELGRSGAILPFPAPGPSLYRDLPRHAEACLRRAAALHAASQGQALGLVASPAGLLRLSLTPHLLATRVLSVRAGEEMTPEILLEALEEGGYRREDPVTAPGQFARRGGIVDIFPSDREQPIRIELYGDIIESLRSFDPDTQRTLAPAESVTALPLSDLFATRSILAALRDLLPRRFPDAPEVASLLEAVDRNLPPEDLVELIPLVPGAAVPPFEHLKKAVAVVLDPEAVDAEAEAYWERARQDHARRAALALDPEETLVGLESLRARLFASPSLRLREVDPEARGHHVACRPVPHYAGDVRSLSADLRAVSGPSLLFLGNNGRADRLRDLLAEDGLATGPQSAVDIRVGALSAGFELPDVPFQVLADGDIFPEEVHLHRRGRRVTARSFLSDFRDLRIGDLVIHQDHGIGRFEGLETLDLGGLSREFMVLVYQGGDKLKVPVDAFDRVQKYASAEGARPALDRLGGGNWEKVKKRVKKAMRDMAAELLKLYAERKARPGHAFAGQSPWQHEFEEAFEYEETQDQATAIAEVAADMASDSPMDRLICGDVGYGKTEVAMRGAMRAVLDGKQVAVLSPTTILAFQHWKTFRKRFAPFPVAVDMVSRFRSTKEIKATLAGLASGKIDILVGTHRLLSKDVVFRDLGLVVIDEEQRFGVAAKEKLKHLRTTVDCLTLSATPIPRTLQMGLAGIRDMSVIETPPKDRLAIQTSIVKFSTETIAAAVRQELLREGQVYLVHNRVESIYSLAALVQRLVPEARVAVAHGQMPEAELEKTMLAFVEGRADVLVATTIIENGLDIPRANTLIVNRADRYGLAQLYQLRGRVGRSDRRAYAYLLVPPDTVLSQVAQKRLAAIREFSDLGAGFRIAALDLEIRGAGNLLGGEQSGHIQAIGLDLYVKLLEQTILELKGEPSRERSRAVLNLHQDLRIPGDYAPDAHQRMSLYKRVSQAATPPELESLRAEVRDRYGPLPLPVDGLFAYAFLRLRAEALSVTQVDVSPGGFSLKFGPDAGFTPEALVAAVARLPGARLNPEGIRLPRPPGEAVTGALAAILSGLEQALAAPAAIIKGSTPRT